jgi:hypothetical protein
MHRKGGIDPTGNYKRRDIQEGREHSCCVNEPGYGSFEHSLGDTPEISKFKNNWPGGITRKIHGAYAICPCGEIHGA